MMRKDPNTEVTITMVSSWLNFIHVNIGDVTTVLSAYYEKPFCGLEVVWSSREGCNQGVEWAPLQSSLPASWLQLYWLRRCSLYARRVARMSIAFSSLWMMLPSGCQKRFQSQLPLVLFCGEWLNECALVLARYIFLSFLVGHFCPAGSGSGCSRPKSTLIYILLELQYLQLPVTLLLRWKMAAFSYFLLCECRVGVGWGGGG